MVELPGDVLPADVLAALREYCAPPALAAFAGVCTHWRALVRPHDVLSAAVVRRNWRRHDEAARRCAIAALRALAAPLTAAGTKPARRRWIVRLVVVALRRDPSALVRLDALDALEHALPFAGAGRVVGPIDGDATAAIAARLRDACVRVRLRACGLLQSLAALRTATRRGAHDGARPTAALVARLVERMREDTDQRVVDAAGRALDAIDARFEGAVATPRPVVLAN